MTVLTTLPVTIHAEKLAAGFLGMFSESEKTALRFGLLPAEKTEVLEKVIKEKFASLGAKLGDDPDLLTAMVSTEEEFEIIEFSLSAATSEAVKLVTLELYKIGDLVV